MSNLREDEFFGAFDAADVYYMSSRPAKLTGAQRINMAIFDQGAVWVDSKSQVWSLQGLHKDHLDSIIAWINMHEATLESRYAVHSGVSSSRSIYRSPLLRALRREQKRRTIKSATPSEGMVAAMDAFTETIKEMFGGVITTSPEHLARWEKRLADRGYEVRKRE